MFNNAAVAQKFGKGQMDAVAATATTWTMGMQEIAAQTSDFAKSAYEGFVAQSTKVGELYASLMKDACKPVEQAFAKPQAAAVKAAK